MIANTKTPPVHTDEALRKELVDDKADKILCTPDLEEATCPVRCKRNNAPIFGRKETSHEQIQHKSAYNGDDNHSTPLL
jgi:hypothetical protein